MRQSIEIRYEFTYDGPRDAEEFSLEFALGLLEFEPVSKNGQSERVRLRDPSHGPRLDELLKLTRPSEKPQSKRTPVIGCSTRGVIFRLFII